MFSSKSKMKVNLDRAVAGAAQPAPKFLGQTESTQPSAAPTPVLRPMENKRRGPRKDLWCVCSVETKGGEIREGVIVDISKTGARVRFRSRGTLPRVVRVKASRLGLKRFARIIWQSAFDAGLEFVPDHKIGNTAPRRS